jgi:hypothetical protein
MEHLVAPTEEEIQAAAELVKRSISPSEGTLRIPIAPDTDILRLLGAALALASRLTVHGAHTIAVQVDGISPDTPLSELGIETYENFVDAAALNRDGPQLRLMVGSEPEAETD